MTFTTKTYEQDFIHAQICSFEGKGGVTEYHIMFSVTDPSLSFGEQLDSLQRAYDAVTKKEAGNAVAVFHRYFLSDAANQADILMERECENPFCALSIVQQAPLNGTKIALWTWLQTGRRQKPATQECLKHPTTGIATYGTEVHTTRQRLPNTRPGCCSTTM